MARLSDMIRRGETALREEKPREEAQASFPTEPAASAADSGADAEDDTGEASFRGLPQASGTAPVAMKDFPILSQIHNEVGTVSEVVNQINQISAFIEAFTAGDGDLPAMARASAAARSAPAPVQTGAEAPPPPPAVPEPVPEAVHSATEEEVEVLHNELQTFVRGVMQACQAGQTFTVDEGFVLIARVVDLPGATDILYRRAIYTREQGDSQDFSSAVVLHSVNVAVYALKIGEGLSYNRDQQIDLGLAGLIHDAGMVKLPPEIFTKGKYDQADIERLQRHPIDGHNALLQLGESYKWVAEIALQEHERDDGSGYPSGLSGNQIHEYARIIGVADTYAGLTRSRSERRGLLPFEAVKDIIQTQKQKFDPQVVRVLLSKLSAFPIGSLVRLNSGAIGTVVETEETYPLRPVIRILYDAQGRKIEDDRVIQLREYPILHITDAIYEEDLEQK